MSKEITKELLEKFNEKYSKCPVQNAIRHALTDTDITACAKKMEQGGNYKNRFSIDIKTLPATSQMQSGRCWIFSGLNTLREETAKNLNLADFEFSQNYTAFWDKYEKANFFMEAVIELKDRPWQDRTLTWILQGGVNDGGQWDMLTANIEKYGLVPKDVMPETYASSHTRTQSSLINSRLRKFAIAVKKATTDEEIATLKEECQYDIYKIYCSIFGVPTQKFDFEWTDKDGNYHIDRDLTPKTFYDKYCGVDFNNLASLINSPRVETPFYENYTVKFLGSVVGVPVKYLNLPIEELKQAVIDQLKDGKVVWFGSDCSKYGDRTSGIWAKEYFDYQGMFGVNFDTDKEDALHASESAMNHAMVITGVNLVDDRPTKWKIENSWGQDVANKGYFVCSDSWFDRYVYQAVVEKKYLSSAAVKALEGKVNELEPWDPMGTLAD